MAKLTPNMAQALLSLEVRGPGSAYSLRLKRGTLDALVARGLASAKYGRGHMSSPATSIDYAITLAGRFALSEHKEGERDG